MITSCYRSGDAGGAPGWSIQFGGPDFDLDKIEAIKAIIPRGLRVYNPESQEWWFSVDAEAALEQVLPEFGAHRWQPSLFDVVQADAVAE